jgi:alpha-glucosidase
VAGLKFGFVDGLTQQGIRWLATAIRKVNQQGFILDVHDNYKPTGLSRTWPALLTQEGIRGDENGPDAFHTTTLPFTRFLAGPADFTFCYPNARHSFARNLKVSKAQQMALTVIYFSPLQSIFWYGNPDDYTDETDIEFFTLVPTVWNETHYLSGEIGKYVSVARRHGNTWFIGIAAGPDGYAGSVQLDFLQPGRRYAATVYEDDGQGGIRKSTRTFRKGDRLTVHLPAAGGQALILH